MNDELDVQSNNDANENKDSNINKIETFDKTISVRLDLPADAHKRLKLLAIAADMGLASYLEAILIKASQ